MKSDLHRALARLRSLLDEGSAGTALQTDGVTRKSPAAGLCAGGEPAASRYEKG
ncbi:MAG: hypothetical protein ACRDI1_08070 [Actinomycetota bacterium]